MLHQELGDEFEKYNIQIFGTDLDEPAITYARQARYSESSLIGLPSKMLDKYFVRDRDSYRVIQSIRDVTVFANTILTESLHFPSLMLSLAEIY